MSHSTASDLSAGLIRVSAELLPTPGTGRAAAESFVATTLAGLYDDGLPVAGSTRFRGGQAAADAALASLRIDGYATGRNEVFPERERSATALSPYLRHGLIRLVDVWDHVRSAGRTRDADKLADQLLWQEYARHWYARMGHTTKQSVRWGQDPSEQPASPSLRSTIEPGMACLELTLDELDDDGWIPNQSRLWVAGHWTVREDRHWQEGEDLLFRRLLDGSRAANRLGWQWAAGTGSTKPYGFTRWQVEQRAAGLCATCDLVHQCPVENFPDDPRRTAVEQPVELRGSEQPERYAGPDVPLRVAAPDRVWLTAESLGRDDPALRAHPDLPAVFVFDEALLERLRLAPMRLVFLVECLAELAETRGLELYRGDPVAILTDLAVAVTYAPVPGFRRRAARIAPAEIHPWPWVFRPNGGSVVSFSQWVEDTVPDRREASQFEPPSARASEAPTRHPASGPGHELPSDPPHRA
ncbi:MAG: deoxyribodipyrimidine photolyase [Actinomycetota bacterium]|nr:deoxyribodipyrimidine photolyase [Actinomycetota bacterium]